MSGNRGPSDSATRQLYGSPPLPDLGSKERFSRCPTRSRAPEHIRKGCCLCQSAESARNNKGIRRRLSGYRPQSASYARSCSTTRLFCGLQMLRHRGSGGRCAQDPIPQGDGQEDTPAKKRRVNSSSSKVGRSLLLLPSCSMFLTNIARGVLGMSTTTNG